MIKWYMATTQVRSILFFRLGEVEYFGLLVFVTLRLLVRPRLYRSSTSGGPNTITIDIFVSVYLSI